ncbi:MAG TPA: sulfatase-like hydrolase/transferase [Polyangiaceae bacterium]|nr:sulfatase-like hydrolase/transferase [Polyangiaceae bacterium]
MSLRRRVASAGVDAALVLLTWLGAVLLEDVAIGFLWRDQFSGPWEISFARHVVGPIAVALLAPVAIAVGAGWSIAMDAAEGQITARRGFAAAGALAGAALAIGVTEGRHFASWAVRAPSVALLGAAGAAFAWWFIPWIASRDRSPSVVALVGAGIGLAGWTADACVLPRLYPAFHVATLVAALLGAALVALAARPSGAPGRAGLAVGVVACLVAAGCAIDVPRAARRLDPMANLRMALVDHAPILGPVVRVAMAARPAETDDVPAAATAAVPSAPGEVARSLDWSGHDLVLITVDALRADHVHAYGYPRATTPNLDALAAEGTRFDSAYCPTPHTSYSLTSMMTGKYLRPLLTLGLGEDSETWAQDLRRYGWRTGAFYPPAVFFIDEDRFTRFEGEQLGFEYAKVEFADPALREQQVSAYVDAAPADRPLFLWVHFFEPHEPYVVHPDHVFHGGASADVDAYDSEVAAADDGIGRVVRVVRARRAGRGAPAIIVTADHGEEFGEHGGRYHGTTVYDEQVRVPLVVVGPGVRAGQGVSTVVQTIDLLPTALSALGIPRPARLRGRDLGAVLCGDPAALDDGRAFVETDDYELMASGPDRLVCERRAAACALYRPADGDPLERRDVSAGNAARFAAMRALLRETARAHGRYEAAAVSSWPEPLRRGLQGEVEAATDVAALLDDADLTIRRKAAEVTFDLHAPATAPEAKRALAHDEDDEVRRWAALALARMGAGAADAGASEAPPLSPLVEALLHDPSRDWRRAAALALGERGEARACDEIAAWWTDATASFQRNENGEPPRVAIDLPRARELLAATAKARCRAAVPALVRALADVRARPYVADALGALGDDRARAPLLAALGSEPYVTTRPREARALLALGVHDRASSDPAGDARVALTVPAGSTRLVALLSDAHAEMTVSAEGAVDAGTGEAGSDRNEGAEVRAVDLAGVAGGADPAGARRSRHVELRASTGGIVAVWVIPRPS